MPNSRKTITDQARSHWATAKGIKKGFPAFVLQGISWCRLSWLNLQCMDTYQTCTSTKHRRMRSRSCASFRKMPAFSSGCDVDIAIYKLVDPRVDSQLDRFLLIAMLELMLLSMLKGQLPVHVEITCNSLGGFMLLHQSLMLSQKVLKLSVVAEVVLIGNLKLLSKVLHQAFKVHDRVLKRRLRFFRPFNRCDCTRKCRFHR